MLQTESLFWSYDSGVLLKDKDFCCCFSFQAYVGQLCKCGYDFFMEFILSGFNKDLYHVSVAYKLNCFAGMLFPSIFAVYSPCWFLIVNA